MTEQKKNDWLATLFFSPDKTPRDLANFGITTNNSELKDIEYYKNIPQIQEAFKKNDGNFDDSKFTKYYQEALRLYNEADDEQFTQDVSEYYTYDPEDIFAPLGSKRRDLGATLVFTSNPMRQGMGASNLKQTSAPTMSVREVGQENRVFNWDTQKFENWTPNDWGGLKAITRPTLVLAQWDEDGEHEVNGRIVSHKKGDLKFDEFGDTYYETLGNREIAGKDILHVSDTLTVDGSKLNDYDFFDSDGLDKSVSGTIAKTLFNTVPMFIPYVNVAWGSALAVKELGKLLPVLFKSIEGIASGDTSNSKSAQKATNIQAWFSRFDSSTSDYGKSGFFTFENIGQIISSSSGQLWQQRVIGMLPAKISALRHAGMVSDNAKKWGQGISLAYMAGTSSVDSYDAFKEAGASDRIAGLGMIAVMGAFFGLMNNDYFRDMWFKGSYLDRTKVRNTVLEAAKNVGIKEFGSTVAKSNEEITKSAAKLVLKTKNYLLNKWEGMNPGDLMYDTLNEGIEETMEEVSTDAVKGLFLGLNTLGLVDNDRDLNFGITPKNALERYFTSFVGGSIGGAVFSLHNKFEGTSQTNKIISDGNEGLQELIYLIRNGKINDIHKELNLLYTKGKLGSTNLSSTEVEKINTEKGETFQYKPATEGKSQNDAIYRQLTDYVNRINSIVNEEGLNFSDEELATVSLIAKQIGLTPEEVKRNFLAIDKEQRFEDIRSLLVDKKLYSQIFEDWNNLSNEIIRTKASLEAMLTPSETESKTPKDVEAKIAAVQNTSEYQTLKAKLDQLRVERDLIISGGKNDFYMSQLLFASNPEISRSFVPQFGIHNFTRYKYHKEYESLTDDEKATVDAEFEKYSDLQEKSDIVAAHDLFYKFQEDISQSIIDSANRTVDSSNLYKLGSSEFKERYDAITKRINDTSRALDIAISNLSENEDTNEEIENLENQLQNLKIYRDNLSNYHQTILQTALSEEGANKLLRPRYDTPNSKVAFDNYTKSYLEFLDYIRSNNLYLGLVDADLTAILDGWLAINGFNDNASALLTSKIQEALNTSEDVSLLVNPILNIINAIKCKDLSKIIKAYDDTINGQWLDDLIIVTDENPVDFIEKILPYFGNSKFIDYISLIESKKRDIKSSPAIDLIEKAFSITGLSSNDIIETIRTEQNNLLNSKTLEDYIIRDSRSLDKLKETSHMIDVLASAIKASLSGSYNSRINTFRSELNKELLSEIDPDTALSMLKDLSDIKMQIKSLIQISEQNMQQKLNEQKDITFNMRRKFVECLTKEESLLAKTFKEKFGIDTIALAKSFFTKDSYNYENYDKFEIACIEFETALFEEVKKQQNLTKQQLVSTLISCFNPKDLINGVPTKLNKDPDTIVTDYDQLIYLASILSKPSRNFYNELKKIVSSEDYKLAPIFSQEYAVRIADAFITNPGLFNEVILQISNLAKSSDDIYLQTKNPLYNLMSIFGGAGVGKTKGVASLLKKLHPNAHILLSAPEARQVSNLEQSIDGSNGKFTKNELINKILGRPIAPDDIVEIKKDDILFSIQSKVSINVNTDNIFGNAEEKILFIDEISLYDRIELEIISKWAKKNNVKIICLGDYKQNESSRVVNNRNITSSINDCFIIKSPDLVAPLRPDNIAKYDNYTKLFITLSATYDYYYQDTSRGEQKVSTFVEDFLKVNNIEFKYFETPTTFGGEKIVSSTDIKNYIEKLKKLSNDVIIITDHPERYTDSGIRVLEPSQVQGSEFDYIIIDKEWDSLKYKALKDIYTLTQRSRKGTIINNLTLPGEITSKLDPLSSGNLELSEKQIQEFKTWRLGALDKLSTDLITFTPIEDTGENIPEIIDIPNDNESNSESISSNIVTNTPIMTVPSNESVNSEVIKEDAEIIEEPNTENIEDSDFINSDNVDDNSNNNEERIDNVEETNAPKYEDSDDSNVVEVHKETISSIPLKDSQKIIPAEDVLDLYNNDIFNSCINIENGISQIITGIPNPTAKRIVYLLSYYYLNGLYKEDTDKNRAIHAKVMNGLTKTIPKYVGNKYYPFIYDILANNSEPEFYIIPFNSKGLLVARVKYNDKIINIPLFKTDPIIGKYNGDILVASNIKTAEIKKGAPAKTIDVSNFTTSDINPHRLFRAITSPVILSVEESELEQYTEQQVTEFIKNKNNGNTFLLVSTNPFITEDDFNYFLTPTEIDGRYSYTVQHDSTIGLIGVNWTAEFKTFLSYAKTLLNKKSYSGKSIITGSRVASILAIAYKIIPDRINTSIKYHLNGYNPNNRIRVNDKICSTYEEFLTAIKDIELHSIGFGFINKDGKFVYSTGEATLIDVFYYKNNGNLTVEDSEINKINEACANASVFKLGIYGRDIRGRHINGHYYKIINVGERNYETNISQILGNDYLIDLSRINTEDTVNDNTDEKLLSRLNNTLSDLGYDDCIITDKNNIQSVLDTINRETWENLESPNFVILTFDGNNIVSESITDLTAFAASKLKTKIDPINVEYSSKFVPFFVSLQGKQQGYVVEQKDNNWNVREFSLVQEYYDLLNFLKANNDTINNNKSLKDFLSRLMKDEDIDLDTAENYYEAVIEFKELQQKVNNYLMAKLQTYEC